MRRENSDVLMQAIPVKASSQMSAGDFASKGQPALKTQEFRLS
jgi:hypothetical protein